MTDDLAQNLERNIPLSEMIQTLRNELYVSLYEARGHQLRFRVESVELELQVAVSRETEAGGGIKFWVVNAAGKHKSGSQDHHTFKLKLQPILDEPAGATELLVGAEVAQLPK